MKTNDNFKAELPSAIAANEDNKILDWTLDFLQSHEKNKVVVDDIQKRTIAKVHFVEYPLKLLQRTIGPQNGEVEVESVAKWVERVKIFEDGIKNKRMPAPLIATDFWDQLHVVDGNHRHEALLKSGYTSYWTIFILENHESEKKLFEDLEKNTHEN